MMSGCWVDLLNPGRIGIIRVEAEHPPPLLTPEGTKRCWNTGLYPWNDSLFQSYPGDLIARLS